MAIASGSAVQILTVEETTRGTTPSTPAMTVARVTGRNVNLQKAILESAEVRPSRQKADVRHGFNSVVGTIPFELSRGNFDSWLYYLLGDNNATDATPGPHAWNTISQTDNAAALAAGGGGTATVTRSTGSWITDGWQPGMVMTLAGFVAAGDWTVLAVTALVITIYDPGNTIGTEAAGPSKTTDLAGSAAGYIESGQVLKAVTLERGFTDVGKYQPFRGVAFNELSLSIQPESIIGGSFGIIGMSAGAVAGTSLDGTPTAAVTSSPFDAFNGLMMEGGEVVAVVTGLEINIVNGRNVRGVVGSKFSPDVFDGQHIITGSLTAFFEDETRLNKFINEEETTIAVRLDDPNGTDHHTITLPRVKYTGADMDPPQEGPVPLTMPFQALEKTTGNASSIVWSKSA